MTSHTAILSVPDDSPDESLRTKYDQFPIPKLLNRHTRPKLSSTPFNSEFPAPRRILAVANQKQWLAAIIAQESQFALAFSPLSALHNGALGKSDLSPSRTLPLDSAPVSITLASQETQLAVAFTNRISIYDTSLLFSPGQDTVSPVHDISTPKTIKELVSGNDTAIAVVLAEDTVGVLEVGSTALKPVPFAAVSASWSPSGSQLGVGKPDGEIVIMNANLTEALRIPSAITNTLIRLTWITEFTFHIVSGESHDPQHAIIEAKSDGSLQACFDLTAPFPDREVVAPYTAVLGKNSANPCIIIGDLSSDGFEVVSRVEGQWCQRSAETPMQIAYADEGVNVLLGLELDFTETETFSLDVAGEKVDLPPPTILLAYLSDGTIQAWYLALRNSPPEMTGVKPTVEQPKQAESALSNQPTFGQPSTSSPSPFGVQPTQPAVVSGGFGAFASSTPSKFGQTSFGFGTSQPQPKESSATEESGLESAMEGMLGGGPAVTTSSPSAPSPAAPANGMFGSPSAFQAASTTPASSPLKPASGFGAFSQFGSGGTSAFGATSLPSTSAFGSSPFSQTQKPSASAFGQSGFGATAQPAFGQSSFGGASAAPAFGQSSFGSAPAFGQSSFGSTPAFGQTSFGSQSVTPVKAPSTGGFGAFASSGTGSFASVAKDKEKTPASSGGFGSFATTTPSPFGAAPSPFGQTPQKAAENVPVSRASQQMDSPPVTPTRELASPSMSPSPSPPPPSTPPPPKPTTTTASTGAFGGLTSQKSNFGAFGGSSPFMKPATGFGAFAQPSAEASPFYSPKNDLSPGTSVFGAKSVFGQTSPAAATTSPTSTFGQPAAGTTTPTFGSPSALGPPKSVFSGGESTTPKFGTPSALGAPKSVFSSPTTPSPSASPSPFNAGAFTKYTSSFGAAPGGAKPFSEILKGTSPSTTPDKEKTPESRTTTTSPSPAPQEKEVPKEKEKVVEQAPRSSGSEEAEGEDSDEGEVISEPEGSDEENDAEAILSGSDEEGEDEVGEEEEEEGDEEEDAEEEAGSEESEPEEEPVIGKGKEKTTTPPGSPEKPSKPAAKPISAFAPSASSPFGKPFGRPSTKPTRSSPLTSAPVSGDDEEDDTVKVKSEPISPSPSILAPKPIAVVPLKGEIKKEPEVIDDASAKRPKTPPLLSSLFPSKSADAVPQKPATSEGKEPMFKPPQTTFTPSPPSQTPNQQPKSQIPTFSWGGTPKPVSPSPSPAPSTSPSSIFSSPLSNASTAAPSGGFGLPSKPVDTKESPLPKPPAAFGFGLPPKAPSSAPTPPAPTSSPFNASFKPPAGSIFSKPSQPSPSFTSSPTFPGFPAKPAAAGPTPSPAFPGFPSQQASPPAPAPAPAVSAQQTYESGLQSECVYLLSALAKELEDLRLLAQDAVKKREGHMKLMQSSQSSLGLSRSQSSLSLSGSNSGSMSAVVKSTVNSLEEVKNLKAAQRKDIQKLESEMLKAFTRKEEVARFKKAKTDGDFAKMLKVRTLGPEHQEVQTHLRRNIRTVRDRIQKLEGNLHTSKRCLMEYKTGKAGLRAPSLDTINRTCHNIDIAIEHQVQAIASLSIRASAIKERPQSRAHSPYQRDARLPDPVLKPSNVTPHVAIVTAAALNAERSAQRFKSALLNARKEPILNTTITDTPKAPVNLSTPSKPAASAAPPSSGNFSDMKFSDFGEDNFHVTSHLPGRHTEGRRNKTHSPPIIRKSGGFPQSPPAPVAFDWGPLPTFGKK